MAITDGTVLKIVCSMVWDDGEVNQNVFNAVITGGGGPWDAEDVVDDALDWVETMYATLVGQLSENLTGSHITVYEWDPVDDDWDEVGTSAWTFEPTQVVDYMPRGVAALINAKTVDPDVSGKKYIPGTIEGKALDGLWEAAFITALGLFAAEWGAPFAGAITSATWGPVIWSVVGEVAKLMSEEYIIPTIPAYQRRRKNNVGI